MIKSFKKFLSFALVLVLLLPLIGCANGDKTNDNENTVVMTFNDKTITAGEFGYYLANYKSRFAQVFTDFEDTDEFYDSEINGVNAEEYLFDMVVQNVKRTLVSEALFYENGLELNDSMIMDIEYYMDMLIYEKFNNDDAEFNSAVNKLGITALELRDIYLRDEMTYELMSLLAKDKETIGVTDQAMQDYLDDNYSRICHIYVNNKYTYLTDLNGKPVYDAEGKKMTVQMSGKELAAKNDVIAAIDESLADGGDFVEIYDAFSEDKLYKNGYYLTRNTQFIDEVVLAAFELEIGEWIKIESNVGTHYVKRLPMDQKPWEDNANADFFGNFVDVVINEKFGEYLDSFASEVEINEEALEEFDLRTSPVNYIF